MSFSRGFGSHIKSLRRARGMTQEVLSHLADLSADTIRRLEHGAFSPSLETLRKLCIGLDITLTTLFETFELGEQNDGRELMDLLNSRPPLERILVIKMFRALINELDAIADEREREREEESDT